MASKRLARLLLDPALDLAMSDSVATFRMRLGLLLALGALMGFTLGWIGAVWALGALALELEADVALRARIADRRLRRGPRWGFLLRAFGVAVAWEAGPALMMFADGGRFFAAGLVWCAGTVLYAGAISFRAKAYAVTTALPGVTLFAAGAVQAGARFGPATGLALGATSLLYCLFALNAAAINHGRERSLRRTRVKLAHEAQAVRRLAYNDQLTGLVNRRQLTLHLEQALGQADRGGGEVALLLIDLDRFKFVNDTYGHAAGDALLREVAVRLAHACRSGDVCARLGGDEFVVLAPGCGAQDAAALAQRILRRLAEPVALPGAVVHTAGSIGVSLYAGGTADRDLLRQADLALYRVKEHGRNGFCFFETEMDQAVRNRRGLESELRAAIEAGEIGVVYQPQFEGGCMTGVEALARWIHPTRGAVPPSFFVPLAEECGLIEALGMSVIRQAFEDSWRWARLKVSINLSPVQLKLPSFLSQLQELLESSGVPAERIEFELTESILLADDVQTQHTLAALRGLGFRIALDDFGTGYSSLSYLRKFPIDRIKIDRSFIASLPGDKVSEAVVRAVVRLGRSLGLKIVAEGVETPAQMEALAQAGCRAVQGFMTGRPVPAGEIKESEGPRETEVRAA